MKKIALLLSLILSFSGTTVYASYGDANGDNIVDAQDAALILNHSLNSSIKIDEFISDVNNDGKVDSQDAASVMQKTLRSTFLFAKETIDPEINIQATDVLDAQNLPYGKYTKPFSVGDIVISASAVSPVCVEDVELYTDFVTGQKIYKKCLVFGTGSSVCFNNTDGRSVMFKHIITRKLVENELRYFYDNKFEISPTSENKSEEFFIALVANMAYYGECYSGFKDCRGNVVLTVDNDSPIALTKLGYADKDTTWD
ncbi:MAG: hypothetical protein IJL89_04395 [Firmicutes bacterium]|nr:hypothetical protein [Bacillota bacterium]